MKPLRVALLSCGAALLLGRVLFTPFLFGQAPPQQAGAATSPAASAIGVTTPASPASGDAKLEASTNEMRAMQAGIQAYRDEKFPAAALSFTTATAINAEAGPTAHSYAWLARTYLHLHRVPEAEEAARKAVEADKDLANAQTAMAEVYYREGKMAEAETVLVDLVKNKNTMARTYLALAKIHRATANYKNARELIDIAHEYDPKDPDIDDLWLDSMTTQERIAEWKKRLAAGKYEDQDEKQSLAAEIAVVEDRKKNENRSCTLVTKLSQTEAKLEPHMMDAHEYDSYAIHVKVNGVNSTLTLDTGAGGILVSTRIAEKAKLQKIADAPIGGIGDKGSAAGYVAFADKLQIGELEFQHCYIDVVDKKRSLNGDGLIGADVFENYLIDIDFPDQKLKLSQLPPYPDQKGEQGSLQSEGAENSNLRNRWIPPEYKDYERVFRFGHMLLLPVRLNKAPYRLFLLDTGAWDDTLTPAAAQEATNAKKLHKDSDITVKGLSGEVKTVYSTGEVLLTFGRFQQKRTDMVAFDLSHISDDVGTEVSGTLGFAMLYLLDIKLDYRDDLVDFQYDPNRFH